MSSTSILIGIAGGTGSGKTSIISVLNRFYAIQKGDIRIDDINIENILYGWLRNARVFGSAYLEWTGDNLVLRSSQNMFVKRNEHGQIMYYYQKVGDKEEDVRFEEEEIIQLNNITLNII